METVVKDFWDRRPCNVKHSKKTFLSKEYFDEISEKRYFVEKHIVDFCQFDKYKGKKILEIGCGIGTDAVMFAKEGCEYHGLELSNESLEITKKRFEVYGLNGKFYNINSEDMNIFEDNYFDMIYSFGVIHHTENPENVMKEIYRILKPNGEVKIMLYAENSWKKMMIDNGLDQYEAQNGCPIAFTYTNDEIYQLFSDFSNIDIQQHHIFSYKIPPYKENIYEMVDYFDSMPEHIFESLKKKMGWHLCVTCNKLPNILNSNHTVSVNNYPWKHIIIDQLFDNQLVDDVYKQTPSFNDKYWDNGKHFVNEFTNKKEINNIALFSTSLQQIINHLISPEFVNQLEKLTGFSNLIIDKNIYGGGLTLSPKGAKLNKHIDFNYNNDIKLYRAVNLLLYFNDTDGGEFILCDKDKQIVKTIKPEKGKIMIFSSNNKTIHGFNEIMSDDRLSLNLWYYSKQKPLFVDYTPHRTIWFNN